MMATRYMKSGDTGCQVTSTLKKDGSAIDLTGASVLLLLKLEDAPYTAYSLTATIVTAAAGTVKCLTSINGFPTVVGKYKQEWEVTQSDGKTLTFPSGNATSKYNYLVIEPDLN